MPRSRSGKSTKKRQPIAERREPVNVYGDKGVLTTAEARAFLWEVSNSGREVTMIKSSNGRVTVTIHIEGKTPSAGTFGLKRSLDEFLIGYSAFYPHQRIKRVKSGGFRIRPPEA